MSNPIISNIGMVLDGKYKITREIARGGMGIIYEAHHKYTHKRVAIKVIRTNKLDPLQLKRFQKEIDAYSLLSHPNVITIYDAGVYNNYPYIVMEYIEGVDICTYVKQHEAQNTPEDSKNGESKERDWRLCARLIYETALGLEYIHSQKMIHRDIKPANIIVRPDGSPVIIDLGLVKFNRRQSYNLTRSREIMGTIEYMPIEQAQGKEGKIDVRTDVYSLGLVLYELLTGQIAYNGMNIMESCYKIMYYYPALPKEINPQIPDVLEEITLHATEKEKEKRYDSMKEFSNALKRYLDDPTVKPTDQYAQMRKRLWTERNQNQFINFSNPILFTNDLLTNDDEKSHAQNNDSELQDEKSHTQNNDLELQDEKSHTQNNAPELQDEKSHAQNNDSELQEELNLIYTDEPSVQQNYTKVFSLFEKVANRGRAKDNSN